MTGRTALSVTIAALLCGCAAEPDPQIEAIRDYVRETTGDDLKVGGGGLRVSSNDVTTDGRIAKVRGRVENRYDEPVYGIRYVVTFFQPGDPPRTVDRWQHEVETSLEPGEAHGMRLDIDSMYVASESRFVIEA